MSWFAPPFRWSDQTTYTLFMGSVSTWGSDWMLFWVVSRVSTGTRPEYEAVRLPRLETLELKTSCSSGVHPVPGTKRLVQSAFRPLRLSVQTTCTTPFRVAVIVGWVAWSVLFTKIVSGPMVRVAEL